MSNISQFNKAWERAKERDAMSSPNPIFGNIWEYLGI